MHDVTRVELYRHNFKLDLVKKTGPFEEVSYLKLRLGSNEMGLKEMKSIQPRKRQKEQNKFFNGVRITQLATSNFFGGNVFMVDEEFFVAFKNIRVDLPTYKVIQGGKGRDH